MSYMKGVIKKKYMGKQLNKVRQINSIFGEVCVELGILKKKNNMKDIIKNMGKFTTRSNTI